MLFMLIVSRNNNKLNLQINSIVESIMFQRLGLKQKFGGRLNNLRIMSVFPDLTARSEPMN